MKQFKMIYENPRQTEDTLNRLAVEYKVEVLKMFSYGGYLAILVTIELHKTLKTPKKIVGTVKKKKVLRRLK